MIVHLPLTFLLKPLKIVCHQNLPIGLTLLAINCIEKNNPTIKLMKVNFCGDSSCSPNRKGIPGIKKIAVSFCNYLLVCFSKN